ncbi:DUF5675 family protein [Maridesulfovibrio sp. FT414]|uniref:DUF5675 family protein n=1 Tax=Maridesulfovibrio sp. FT414 TaxID=2979469 RepID=UPI003D803CE5
MATKFNLTRRETGDQGTFGRLVKVDDSGTATMTPLETVELPWKENLANVSCIPLGLYRCRLAVSPRYGLCPHIFKVPGRSNILIHYGNWAGDTSVGWYSNSEGCILVGTGLASAPAREGLRSQKMVTNSRQALKNMLSVLQESGVEGDAVFELEVINETGLSGIFV